MLTIRQIQLEALRRQRADAFTTRLADALSSSLPAELVASRLPHACAFAKSIGLTSEQDIARFAAVALSIADDTLPREALSNLQAYGKAPQDKLEAFESWAREEGQGGPSVSVPGFGSDVPGEVVRPCPLQAVPTSEWIEIEMIGEDGRPIPWVAYRVKLPNGEVTEGFLDGQGHARFAGLPQGGRCEIQFPEYDKDAVSFMESLPQRG